MACLRELRKSPLGKPSVGIMHIMIIVIIDIMTGSLCVDRIPASNSLFSRRCIHNVECSWEFLLSPYHCLTRGPRLILSNAIKIPFLGPYIYIYVYRQRCVYTYSQMASFSCLLLLGVYIWQNPYKPNRFWAVPNKQHLSMLRYYDYSYPVRP